MRRTPLLVVQIAFAANRSMNSSTSSARCVHSMVETTALIASSSVIVASASAMGQGSVEPHLKSTAKYSATIVACGQHSHRDAEVDDPRAIFWVVENGGTQLPLTFVCEGHSWLMATG